MALIEYQNTRYQRKYNCNRCEDKGYIIRYKIPEYYKVEPVSSDLEYLLNMETVDCDCVKNNK